MYGAIIGDILGSSYEFEEIKFDNASPHTKSLSDIPLCIDSDHFTDDTVLTLAVMDWLLHDIKKDYYDDEALKTSLAKRFVQWTGFYRDREIAYGLSYLDFFYRAELIQEYIPQNSCGNGSAMRVSPVGWFFDTMEETLRFAKLSADSFNNLQTLAGEKVLKIRDTDGIKIYLENSWVLARMSGTEPIIKLYAETFKGKEHLQKILKESAKIFNL